MSKVELTLPELIKELGDYYKYFKYVPSTHLDYAMQNLNAFKQLVKSSATIARYQIQIEVEADFENYIANRIKDAYVKSDKAKKWISENP